MSTLITTELTALLGVDHPVLLAPMGDAAGGRLAAAVSDAGAFGIVGAGYADPRWLERELTEAGGARVGVGFITFGLDGRGGTLELALSASPPAIQLSFGDPRPYADEIHAAGALLICQVQERDEIAWAVEAGADVVIAQGRDAGGHGRPDRGTFALVPSVVDRVAPIPVVAAGGVVDGRGLAAALMLGASGVTLGTRFLATPEALSNQREADALVAAHAEDTTRTAAFDVVRGPRWPRGHDGRAIRNALIDRFERGVEGDDVAELERAFRGSAEDDYSMRPLWAGEGLDGITAIEPAAAIVERLIEEAVSTLRGSARLTVERP